MYAPALTCTCMHSPTLMCTCVQTHAQTCTRMQSRAHMCTRMHTTHVPTCTRMHSHAHALACTHIYVHAAHMHMDRLHQQQRTRVGSSLGANDGMNVGEGEGGAAHMPCARASSCTNTIESTQMYSQLQAHSHARRPPRACTHMHT